MTSLNCFLMAVIVLVGSSFWKAIRRPAVLQLVIAAMLAVSISVLFLGIGEAALAMMGKDPTLTDRTQVWGIVRSLDHNPLVGTGFESFWLGPRLEKLWSVYWWHPNQAHNGYLEIFLNLGWVGVALLGFVLVRGYQAVIAAYRRNLPMANLRVALFVVGIVYNFTEAAFFRMLSPAWIFFLFAIVTCPALTRTEVVPIAPSLSDRSQPLDHELVASTWTEELV